MSAAQLEKATAELKDATIQAADKDADRQKTQEVFYALEAQLTEARRQLSAMTVDAERTKGRLESQVRESAGIEQRMTRADQESGDLESRIAQNQTERAALAESAVASASLRTFLLHLVSKLLGTGGCALPPPTHSGERIEPARALPVPFCFHGLRPPPETAARFFAAPAPCRLFASCHVTTLWRMSGRAGRPKTSGGRGKEAPGMRWPVEGSTSGAERSGGGEGLGADEEDEAKVDADDDENRCRRLKKELS